MLQNTICKSEVVDLSSAPWTMQEFFAGSGLVAYGLKGMCFAIIPSACSFTSGSSRARTFAVFVAIDNPTFQFYSIILYVD